MKVNMNSCGKLHFGAGNTKIFSDFDGTFMPKEYNHDVICNNSSPVNEDEFSSYFGEFKQLLAPEENGKKTTELTISTGRNLGEFNYYMRKIKDKGLSIPVPDKLIVTNGGDEFLCHTTNYFENDKENMFEEWEVNTSKRKPLKKYIINWDGHKIKNHIKSFISRLSGCPLLIEPSTHQGMYGYKGDMTLQEDIEKLPLEDRTNYISLRRDGDSQIRLTAPYGSQYIEELKGLSDELLKEGYSIDFQVRENNGETFVNKADSPNEWCNGTSIEMKPKTRGKIKTLDKYHHVKVMVDHIIQNDSGDLVIAAGDGSNDLDMLDLSNYIDGMKSSDDFSKPEFREQVSRLPLFTIFVRNSSSVDDKIEKFERVFNFDGVKRFIIVDKNDETRPKSLVEAIKIAKEEYSKINEEYRKNAQWKFRPLTATKI